MTATLYATVTDLEARWRPLTVSEQERAKTLLEDAALRVDLECPPPVGGAFTESELRARVVVVCEMVKRALAAPAGIGVESIQTGAGPYQETAKFTNPTGDLYLTKGDRRLLGCGQQTAFTIPMAAIPSRPTDPWLPLP